jgi:hypothetical protein
MKDQNTHPTDARPGSAEDLIARARAAEPCAAALPDQAADRDQDAWFEAAFAALPPSVFDPVVLAAVDHLMHDSESVSATARQRLVRGADRGVRWRQRLGDQLGHLLRDHRRTLGLSPSAVTSQIGVQAGLLAEIETGSKTIETLPVAQVAAWIRLVSLDPATALAALRRSPHPGRALPGAQNGSRAGFARDLADALGESRSRP